MKISIREISRMIDHSLLHPALTDEDLVFGCKLSLDLGVASVCVKPSGVSLAAEMLEESSVLLGSVAGFSHGGSTIQIKVREAEEAIEEGASEIDVVVNIGKLLGENWQYVQKEIRELRKLTSDYDAVLSVIFENSYLEHIHIMHLCSICSEEEVDYVKNSTGCFNAHFKGEKKYYTEESTAALQLMRSYTASKVRIKAAGGIYSLDEVLHLREIGISRVCVTDTKKIVAEARKRNYPEYLQEK